MNKFLITSTLIVLFLSSCFKEEEAIYLPPTSGVTQVGQVAMGENYSNQIFFDLTSNLAVKTHEFDDWDLGFSCSDTSWHIILNNAKTMAAGVSAYTEFDLLKSSTGITTNFDNPSGRVEDMALYGWYEKVGQTAVSTHKIWLINRGTDLDYLPLGNRKISIEIGDHGQYILRHAKLNGLLEDTIVIEKDPSLNYVSFSFDNGIVPIEPPKTDWTLLFAGYQDIIYTNEGEPVPYLLRGALLNPYYTWAGMDTSLVFDNIVLADTLHFVMNRQLNSIGYEWKYYDFDNGTYSVVPNRNYLIKNYQGYFFKLRFIDFYNSQHQKGYPTFEFQRL